MRQLFKIRCQLRDLITLITLGLVSVFSGSSLAENQRMCGSDWPVWETARAMDSLGRLEGFDFSYEKYGTCIDGFAAGKFDITFMTLYDFIATQRDQANGVIVGVTDYSSGGDGVVLRDGLGGSDLKGKKIALQGNSISLYMAHLYLTRAGLSLGDIDLSIVKGENVGKAFEKNVSLAGIVGWNPNLDRALDAGGKLVATSADFPENIFDVIVVNRDSLAANPAGYGKFLDLWFKSVNDSAVLAEMAKLQDVSVDEYKLWLSDAHIYRDRADSLSSFQRMQVVAGEVQSFLTNPPENLSSDKVSGLFGERPLDVNGLFEPALLQ